MNRVVDIDHLSLRVSNIRTSKAFYSKLFSFLGFKVLADYGNQIGWTNGKTRFWIGAASSQGKKYTYRIGDVGFHHYAFKLRNRKDVDDLYAYLKKMKAIVVDPPYEYYKDYYAVFFLDPDGLKLEGMRYGAKSQGAKLQGAVRSTAKKSGKKS